MKISDNGLSLIKKFEGCRLTAYQDAVGVWTIGYGTTNADKAITGISIRQGLRISQETADEWLRQSVDKKYGPKVDKYSAYNWNQNEFDTLVSFAYNIGSIDGLTASGSRSKEEIADKIQAYNKAGGKNVRHRTYTFMILQNPFFTLSLPHEDSIYCYRNDFPGTRHSRHFSAAIAYHAFPATYCSPLFQRVVPSL